MFRNPYQKREEIESLLNQGTNLLNQTAFKITQQRKAIVTEMAILQKNLLLSNTYPQES
jgi:hypothetical protein